MTDLQLFTLRNDIAYYACMVCSVASRDWMGAVWLLIALVILVLGKVGRERSAALHEGSEK